MHNIGYITRPENVDRGRVLAMIQDIAEHDGDGYYTGGPKWHDEIPPMESEKAAEAKIKELDKGWYDDHAVRFYDYSEAQETKRMTEIRKRITETQDRMTAYAKEHSVKAFKAEYIGCPKCGSKLSRKHLGGDFCPLCRTDLRSDTTRQKLHEYGSKIDMLWQQIEDEKKKQTKAKRVMWLIKYEYHS